MDTARTDLVLQHILAAAGAREPGSREVTATQLVKYAYLADLAHAARNEGATFTLAPWAFTQQGPHAQELFDRIAPIVRRTGAVTRGAYYTIDDEDLRLLREAERALPAVVTSSIANAVRAFARDTSGLLAHVYATAPMRRAAPGDVLDFTPDAQQGPAATSPPGVTAAGTPSTRAFPRAQLNAIAARIKSARREEPHEVYAPRYGDACFEAGQRALDAEPEARPVIACEGSLTVDPDVWTAEARKERDVP